MQSSIRRRRPYPWQGQETSDSHPGYRPRHRRPSLSIALIAIGTMIAIAAFGAMVLLAASGRAHAAPPADAYAASTVIAGQQCTELGATYREEDATFVCRRQPGEDGSHWRLTSPCLPCLKPCPQCGPSPSHSPRPSPSMSKSPGASPSASLSASPSASVTMSKSPSVSASPTPGMTRSPSPDVSVPPDESPWAAPPGDAGGGLPNTGSRTGLLLLVGGLLLGLGVVLVAAHKVRLRVWGT